MHPYEEIPLSAAGYCVAAYLIISHLWMLLKPEQAMASLQKLPRNRILGIVFTVVGFSWFWLLVAPEGLGLLSKLAMDLGEFNNAKPIMRLVVPIAAFLVITEVKEFLAVRSLGVVCLMAAAPLLYAAFLEPFQSRLMIAIFAYAMITKGLFWVGMPYLMRDAISWATASVGRFKMLVAGGLAYGIAVLACTVMWW
ncbi:hypothetical protein [Persicirhabdus sediminis]|uniref:Uncharacterized protein n=1 Tax=Persicirhabdus sediminis TaxID=454144 RepID=A0A8J7MFX1_9BACT|nr:hypothetical protein [Persicirhabdus sediminis]MBK1792046.1 hypothetical protein [Persicirhabdus sediminis]